MNHIVCIKQINFMVQWLKKKKNIININKMFLFR